MTPHRSPDLDRGDNFRSKPCVGLACALFFTLAHATSPKLTSVLPTGGQRGTDVELKLGGARLDDTEEIILYSPGIEVLNIESAKTNAVKARIKITPDCRLGEHQLRVRTATGVSDLRTFFVGAFPVIEEKEPNNDPTKAQSVPLNSTVAGVIASEDVDCFQIEVKKGHLVSAEVEAMRLGRGAFDAHLTVFDPGGRKLAAVDDTTLAMQDPFVSFIAPADGSYLVQVRETAYGGRDDYHYRLHVGTFPRPTSAFPPGGKAGETLTVKLWNEATGEFTQQVKLPDTPREKFALFAERETVSAPTPNWLRVAPFPNVVEAASSRDGAEDTTVTVPPPFALNGTIARKGETDSYRFKAEKGQTLEMSVFARRLRSPLDSVVEVFDSAGKQVASNDDAGGADSSLKFTPAESGDYVIRIKDQLGQSGRDFVYRIEVTPQAPSLTLKIPEVARNDTQSRQHITVPRGNRFATLISAKRVNFSGDLAFDIEGLPPGLTLHADTMAAKLDAMPLVFEAAPDAPSGGKLLDLTARPVDTATKVVGHFRNDVELVQGGNNSSYYSTSVDRLYVAVTKEATFKLRIEEPKVPLVQAGAMDLKIVADRQPGFDEPINVQLVWKPPGVSAQTDVAIAKGADSTTIRLNANSEAQTAKWKIAVLGNATVDGGPLHVSTQLAPLEIASPFLAGKIDPVSVSPGQSAKLVCKLDQKEPFEGKATVKLMGLPEKVSVPEKTITKDDREVVFDIAVPADCPTGSHRNLFCAVDVKQAGQVIPHSIARGGILRIVPAKRGETKVVANAQGNKK